MIGCADKMFEESGWKPEITIEATTTDMIDIKRL